MPPLGIPIASYVILDVPARSVRWPDLVSWTPFLPYHNRIFRFPSFSGFVHVEMYSRALPRTCSKNIEYDTSVSFRLCATVFKRAAILLSIKQSQNSMDFWLSPSKLDLRQFAHWKAFPNFGGDCGERCWHRKWGILEKSISRIIRHAISSHKEFSDQRCHKNTINEKQFEVCTITKVRFWF